MSLQSKIKKLSNGHKVQFKPSDLVHFQNAQLSQENRRKVQNAIRKGTGARIQFSVDEIQGNGIGKQLKRAAKSVGKTIKKIKNTKHLGRKIINTSEKINNAIGDFADMASIAAPEYAPAIQAISGVSDLANMAVKSGVNATRKRATQDDRTKFANDLREGRKYLETMGSGIKNPYLPDKLVGGSFRANGGSFRANGKGIATDQAERHRNGKNFDDNSILLHYGSPGFHPYPPQSLKQLMGLK